MGGIVKVVFEQRDFRETPAEMMVVPCFKKEVPKWAQEALSKYGVGGDFTGEKGKTYLLPTPEMKSRRVLFIGFGREKTVELEDFRLAGAKMVRAAKALKLDGFSVWVDFNGARRHSEKDVARAVVEGAVLANLKLAPYKKKKRGEKELGKMVVFSRMDLEKEVAEAAALARAQNYARIVGVEPANFMTPKKLAETAGRLAKECGLGFRVMGKKELEKMGMHGILGVSYGSAQEPVLVELKYNAGVKGLPHIILVGKGITFDSGGISIKPSKGMDLMKYDKSGAVVMLGVMRAAAELKIPIKLTALLPATENMPGGSATKPGDILKMYNGKSVEVINTDAEGRLILADALAYGDEMGPDLMIDAATLTGAVSIVLGRHGIGMLGTDKASAHLMYDCGLECGERVWELPLWKEYSEMMKGDYADLKNIGSESGEAGTITAAAFLKEFVGKTPWVHLDIASVEWSDGSQGYFCKGPTGKGVRLITTFLKRWVLNRKRK